jgi:hypothetical protein
MGIGDLGGPAGGQPSDFTTTTFRGTAAIADIAAYNHSLGDPYSVSIQLNAFLVFDFGSNRYAYWAQDVAILSTSTRTIAFEDNVWNVTSDDLEPNGIHGNGTVSGSGSSAYYGDGASCSLLGACSVIPNPQMIELELAASLGAGGVPTVRFLFANGGGAQPFDTVTFPYATSLTGFQGFAVDPGLGFSPSCVRCFGDVELVLGGPGNGSQTVLDGTTDLNLSLEWWNGFNFEPVPNAMDHGEATEEGISKAIVQPGATAAHEPIAKITYGGAGPFETLWSQSSVSTLEVSVVTGSSGGELSINGSLLDFSGKFVETIVVPGTVPLEVDQGASTYPLGSPDLLSGEVLTLEVGAEALVFVPSGLPASTVWSVTVGSQQLDGTGNITFGEVAGAYGYSVGSPSGYRATSPTGNASVSTMEAVVPISFSSTHTSLWSSLLGGLGPYGPLLLVVVVLAVAVAVVAVALSRRPTNGP